MSEILLAIPFGVAIGIAMGMLGGGGSVLAVPVLVFVLGQEVEQATTASLVVAGAAALAGGLGHARAGRVCLRHAALFGAGALPGIGLGTLAGDAASGGLLLALFAALMLGAAVATWRNADGEGTDPDVTCPPVDVVRALAAGAGVGLMTGFFGVGGGFLIVPALAIALGLGMRAAVATSLAVITLTSVLGIGVHLLAGRSIDVPVTLVLAAGCVVGSLVGAALAPRVEQRTLGRAFAVLLVVVALYLLGSVAISGGPPGA